MGASAEARSPGPNEVAESAPGGPWERDRVLF